MKLLKEISERSLGLSDEGEKLGQDYRLRKSARAIILNVQGLVAAQYLTNYNYHKLPGGGINHDETPEEALKREVLEEIGCECEIVRPVGIVIEYRNKLLHISYAYVVKVIGEIGNPTLEAGEIEEGQTTLWLPVEELLQKMESDKPLKHEGYFILEREKTFLREYLNCK